MKLSRWPNSDYRTDWASVNVRTKTPAVLGYSDDTISKWTYKTDDIWFLGYWWYDWAAEFSKGTIDAANKQITLQTDLHYGVNGNGRPMRAYNVYEEIDEPGEWYLDRNAGKLYFYPPAEVKADSVLTMTDKTFDLVSMDQVSNVTFRGISFTGGRGLAVNMKGGENNQLSNCDIHLFEQSAVSITGDESKNNGLDSCAIYNCGAGAITLRGGLKESVTPAGNYVKNSVMHDVSMMREVYAPGVDVDGVGNVISHNEFYNSPHQMILFHGVETVMEYNKFHNVCKNAADMGVIYTGRNVADQGNLIRYNHFYNVGTGFASNFAPCCIFTDDGSSNLEAYGNVFGPNVTSVEVIKIHGGIYNRFHHNLYIDAPEAYYQSGWNKGHWYNMVIGDSEPALRDSFLAVKDNPLYLEKWPWLRQLKDTSGSPSTIVYEELPNQLYENVLLHVNVTPGSGQIRAAGSAGFENKNNLIWKNNPDLYRSYVKDWQGGNYTLTDEAYSVIRESIANFPTIPFEAIGPAGTVNAAPIVKNVKIQGSAIVGETVLASYLYTDAEGDPEEGTAIEWLVSDKADSGFTALQGETKTTLNIVEELSGKYLKVRVTPKDGSSMTGVPVESAAVYVVADKESLGALIESVQKLHDGAAAGEKFGQYPQSAKDELQQAIDAAKAIYENPSSGMSQVAAATEALNNAAEAFRGTQISSVSFEEAGERLTIPTGMSNVQVGGSELPGQIQLIPRGGTFPDTKMYGTVDGIDTTLSIAKGTKAEELTVKRLSQPSQSLYADPVRAVLEIGKAGQKFDPAMTLTIAADEADELYLLTDDGYVKQEVTKENGTLKASLTVGGEYVVGKPFRPSGDATLSEITIDGKKLQKFTPETEQYNYLLAEGAKGVVGATAASDAATVAITQAAVIPGTATIVVTAQDKTQKTYSVKLGRISNGETTDPTPTPTPANPGGGTATVPSGTNSGTTNRPNQTEQQPQGSKFSDIIGHWAEKEIQAMANRGIVSGVTETTFEPDREITRAEFATLVVKALNLKSTVSAGFTDVAEGAWYTQYVNAAANAGFISGYAGTFRPEDVITREEMAVVIIKTCQFMDEKTEGGQLDFFRDQAEVSPWARDYVDCAVSMGLISGVEKNVFAPAESATRAQVTAVLYRLLNR